MNMFRDRHAANDPAPQEKPAEVDYLRFLTELRTELTRSFQGVVLRGSRAVQIAGPGGTNRPTTAAGRLTGWNIALPNFATGSLGVTLYDGADSNGFFIAHKKLTIGETWEYQHPGINLTYGLYVDVDTYAGTGVASELRGAVFLGEAG